MFKAFRDFAIKGNVVDLAVAFVLGVAFTAVVNSLVKDIFMPPIGYLLGGVNFNDMFISLNGSSYPSLAAAEAAGAPVVAYGRFFNQVITFIVVAFVLFLIVQPYNRARAAEAVTTKDCPYCATSIPLGATRCPFCTSELEAHAAA